MGKAGPLVRVRAFRARFLAGPPFLAKVALRQEKSFLVGPGRFAVLRRCRAQNDQTGTRLGQPVR